MPIPIQKPEKIMIRNSRGWNCHEGELKELFGLSKKDKWPSEGLPAKLIQGIRVWVNPKTTATTLSQFHRCRAQCPRCLKVLSAGRLHQHKCKETT
jgi:hypothetical protein